jgi:hypothetical protein
MHTPHPAQLADAELFQRDEPLIYALDRRGPNDPRFGSIHVLIAVMVVLAALGLLVVL